MASVSVFISKHQTDWDRCCLCQTEKKDENLKLPPPDSKGKDGYTNITKNVPQFNAMNRLPLILDPRRVDEGGGIETTLRKRQAQYHQSCRLMFNNTKLDMARKDLLQQLMHFGKCHRNLEDKAWK
ncbi:hypothetical protein DPMN_173905 [Dreissena polymorpha]|uniref:Uncharacterized protein n=1 Tax=Dreissena polymorpha TaxID=45954 RepID=A0A9D4IGK6_DREPO|nr:hypothetical protein DPMN_173905 [Dreissena polymorpha]